MSDAGRTIIKTALRWALPLAALLVIGPLVYLLTEDLRTRFGDEDVTLLANRSPALGLLAFLAAIAAAGAVGFATRLLTDARTALRTAGFILAWAAWGTGEMNEVLHQFPSAGAVLLIAGEGFLVLLGAVILLTLLIPSETAQGERSAAARLRTLITPASLAAISAGLAGAVLVSYLVVLDAARGQAVFGAIASGIAGGAAARFATVRMDDAPSPVALHLGPVLAAVLAPLILFVAPGLGQLPAAAALDALPAPARVQPADWLAGALIGVPIGLAWVASMLEGEGANAAPGRSVRHA